MCQLVLYLSCEGFQFLNNQRGVKLKMINHISFILCGFRFSALARGSFFDPLKPHYNELINFAYFYHFPASTHIESIILLQNAKH